MTSTDRRTATIDGMRKRSFFGIAGPSGLIGLALVIAATLLPGFAAAQATRGGSVIDEQRVALVIGNAGYRDAPLDNAVNDARLIARSLEQAGFKVTLREDLPRAAMLRECSSASFISAGSMVTAPSPLLAR